MTFTEGIKQSEKVYEQLVEMNSSLSQVVVNAYLFTWQWWLGIGLFIIPWILWCIFKKKESTGRLLMGGIVAIILSIIIDLIALSYGLWSYPLTFSPIAPLLFLPYHFSLTPVAIMFFFQIKPKSKPLLKGLIFAAIAAFGGMNLFKMLDFYNPKGWSTFYDFFIFLTIYCISYLFSNMDSFKKITDGS